MFEHQFRHKVVGLESKFFWLLLAQQISFTASTCTIRVIRSQDISILVISSFGANFSIVKSTELYSTMLLQFVIPTTYPQTIIIIVCHSSITNWSQNTLSKLQVNFSHIR